MAFFDFFKGKNKKEEIREEEKQKTKDDGEFEFEGLEVSASNIIEADGEIKLNLREDLDPSIAMNRAVRNAMDQHEIEFHLGAGGTLYKEDTEGKEMPSEEFESVEITPEEFDELKNALEDVFETKVLVVNPEEEKEIEEVEEVDKIKEVKEVEKIEKVEKVEETKKEIDEIKEVEKIEETTEEEKVKKTEKMEVIAALKEAQEKKGFAESSEKEKPEEPEESEKANNENTTKKGFFSKLIAGLDKTRKNILGGVDHVLGAFTKIDEELFEELEEVLIMADLGIETTMNIIENLRKRVKKEKTTNPQEIRGMVIDEITEILQQGIEDSKELPVPTVMLVIGVNGVGKTTTIGKLSHNLKEQGRTVLLGAADTFRAAAIDQLEIWGERAGIDVIKHQENSDPAAVVFDAVNAAKNRKTEVLICDTAGRLHNKKNLMEELKKISKVIDREYPEANKEVYLVLDATTGQNAMQQAKLFKEVTDITGIILTKLDGTAKGGIVIAIKAELQIPVRYIGVGEGIDDLQEFDAKEFARALFGES